MKVAILLESHLISGGTYVIFEHGIRMLNRGNDVTIVTKNGVNENELKWHEDSKQLRWETYETVEDYYDVVIATWWQTVFLLHKINAGKYVYFVQSIESKFYPEERTMLKNLADSTYMLPVEIITEATWIQEYLNRNYGKKAYLVRNGIRKDIYIDEGAAVEERDDNKLRVLVEGPLKVSFKNVEKTIELCREALADEVWLLTSTKDTENIKGVDRIFSNIGIYNTPTIYRSCDVIVKLSYVEGMFGPPLEMFHCGGTAIVYDVTGYDEYLVDNYNSIVIKMGQEKNVIEAINELKDNKELLVRLKKGAITTASQWGDWEDSSLEFEKVLSEIIDNPSGTQEQVKKHSEILHNLYDIAETFRVELRNVKK